MAKKQAAPAPKPWVLTAEHLRAIDGVAVKFFMQEYPNGMETTAENIRKSACHGLHLGRLVKMDVRKQIRKAIITAERLFARKGNPLLAVHNENLREIFSRHRAELQAEEDRYQAELEAAGLHFGKDDLYDTETARILNEIGPDALIRDFED